MDWTGRWGTQPPGVCRLLPFLPFLLAGSRGIPAPLGSRRSSLGFSELRTCLLSACVLGHGSPECVTGSDHLHHSVWDPENLLCLIIIILFSTTVTLWERGQTLCVFSDDFPMALCNPWSSVVRPQRYSGQQMAPLSVLMLCDLGPGGFLLDVGAA